MERKEIEGTVCFFNSCKEWGGGEKWHLEMAKRLQDKGVKVILCAFPGSPLYHKAKEANIVVYSFKISNLSFLNPFLLKRLKNFFRKKHIVHILLNLPSDLKTAGRAARAANVNNIIYRRGSAIPISNSLSNKYLFKRVVDYMIVNSKETKRTILSRNSNLFDKDKIQVIYNGIDTKNYPEAETESGNTTNEVVLGNAGRLEKQKNHLFLIELVSLLHQKGYKVSLRIAGSGRLEENLQNTIKGNNLEHYIELLGFKEDIKSFLSTIDIFVLPSLWEGFGYVIVEALASNRPVVAFNTSSNPEIVSDGNDGFLVPKGNLEAFADKIIQLIENPELRERMGYSGAEKVKEQFDIQTTTNKLTSFIQKLEKQEP